MDSETIRILKEYASEKTGVPVHLINGETSEEIAASAAALAAFKRQHTEAQQNAQPLPAREQFADWLDNVSNNDIMPEESAPDPLPEVNNGYPKVPDGGTPQNINYKVDPRESFKEWFYQASAFNPFKDHDLW